MIRDKNIGHMRKDLQKKKPLKIKGFFMQLVGVEPTRPIGH